ncbi:MAG: HEAT repeat domain-containing protein [Acidobacteria bacterium]|nr:HEAT repeat domain-containing protein [Acidobacteriota bacterium]
MMGWTPFPATLAYLSLGLASVACAPAHDAPSLYQALQDTDPEVRLDARDTIASLKAAGDYQVFARGLDSPSPLHKIQSILYLAEMPQEGASRTLRELLARDRRLMLAFNPIRLKPSIEEHDSRIMVAHLIRSRGGDDKALPTLLEGLDPSQDREVVVGTCFAVGALGDPGGIPFLASAARSPEVAVARAAVQALGQFELGEILGALDEALSHPAKEVRGDVLSSLAPSGDGPGLDLVLRVAGSDPEETLRLTAIERLSVASDPTVTGFLIDLLDDESENIRRSVSQFLSRRTGQNFGEDHSRWSRWWSEQSAGDPAC